jgi:hypothetical protein
LFLSAWHVPHNPLVKISSSNHGRDEVQTAAGRCPLNFERSHRSRKSCESSLCYRPSTSCFQFCQCRPDYDPSEFPPPTRRCSILTCVKDLMANELDYIELGLSCADVCQALDRGTNGKRLDELNKSVLSAIGQLTV